MLYLVLSPHAAQRAPAVLSPTLKIAALIGIAALAVALRLTLLTEMPASLFKDEGRHALKAIRILDDSTYRPVYEPEIALPAMMICACERQTRRGVHENLVRISEPSKLRAIFEHAH